VRQGAAGYPSDVTDEEWALVTADAAEQHDIELKMVRHTGAKLGFVLLPPPCLKSSFQVDNRL
jgi:hypothetical protein